MMLPQLSRIGHEIVIGVFAPSEPLTDERWARVLQIEQDLKARGFVTKYSANIHHSTYDTAGSPQARVEAFHSMLADNSIDVLFGVWGGKGCIELLDKINYRLPVEYRKPIFGVSDVAVLLNAISAKSNLITFYGPNIFGKLDEVSLSRLDFLFDTSQLSPGVNILPAANEYLAITSGQITGRLFGGDLDTFLHANSGTDYVISPERNIFLWETSQYNPQKIKQMIYSLKLRGIIDNIGGMIIGHLGSDLAEYRWAKPNRVDFLMSLFDGLNIPILYAPIFGHSKVYNPVFPLGAICSLNCVENKLVLEQSVILERV